METEIQHQKQALKKGLMRACQMSLRTGMSEGDGISIEVDGFQQEEVQGAKRKDINMMILVCIPM